MAITKEYEILRYFQSEVARLIHLTSITDFSELKNRFAPRIILRVSVLNFPPFTLVTYSRMATDLKEDNESTMINPPEGFEAPLFMWDAAKTSPKIKLDAQCLRGISMEGSGFKTTVGTQIFVEGGRYYFEIFINKGQLIKIGVSRPKINNLDEAFSDSMNGWAIYNGQTRHGSNSSGPTYGTQLTPGDILGVALDMVEGTLTYYHNKISWGVAFKDEELKKGELVAAVSPIYNNDTFTLRNMIKQD